MKKRYLILLLIALAPLTYASTDNPMVQRTFKLGYKFAGEFLEVESTQSTYEKAIEDGSMKCFNFFTHAKDNTQKVKMDEDKALDLIDVCANPRRV